MANDIQLLNEVADVFLRKLPAKKKIRIMYQILLSLRKDRVLAQRGVKFL